jgi:sporulation protein YlmC with PRC-barrel domain
MVDDGPAIHYSAVPRGTPVYDANGNEIGTVDQVMDNYREHILDGFVIRMPKHGLRFVDAPEVARTAERGVTLTITAAEAESLPPPPDGGAVLRPNLGSGTLGRLFGGRKRQ